MEVVIEKQNEVVTVFLKGRLDTLASQEVSQQLEGLSENASGTIIMDCTEMSYISSSGLRIFLTLRKAASEKGGKVIVRGISNDIRSVFMMTGFLNLFEIQELK
ncbi:MAG: STAS domain-containing protein [Bacteroidales bacterium]|nr:STAS domain-containing protein [Bacteroidales bacterium]